MVNSLNIIAAGLSIFAVVLLFLASLVWIGKSAGTSR
jgi:hypothetical protein